VSALANMGAGVMLMDPNCTGCFCEETFAVAATGVMVISPSCVVGAIVEAAALTGVGDTCCPPPETCTEGSTLAADAVAAIGVIDTELNSTWSPVVSAPATEGAGYDC